jgi:NADP-dependent aldehyde dehydrogenase
MLRLTDIAEPAPAEPGEAVETVVADLRDLDAMVAAVSGCDAVLHLGGIPTEDSWQNILDVNVVGTRHVLEAARLAGVRRVILASSHHPAGMHPRRGAPSSGLPASVEPRPDTYYGFSTAAMEALGRLYADRWGMEVVALRIGTVTVQPVAERTLATWLSPDDAARLVEACLSPDVTGYHVVWGVSRNTRSWWSRSEGEAIGYFPEDDAETFAGRVPPPTPLESIDLATVGGAFTRFPVGERPVHHGAAAPAGPPAHQRKLEVSR